MSKRPKIDTEILSILGDYQLFIDSDKHINMPFYVNEVDINHTSSLKGATDLTADHPFGKTVLECEMKDKNEYRYTFKILSDRIVRRMLFRMDEGEYAHWNRHLPVPIDQQQVPTPHFHKIGDDGIEYAYSTPSLKTKATPLNIYEGFDVFCDESHIDKNNIQIVTRESGTLFDLESEMDPTRNVIFP